ncbi:Endo-1,3-beta-glucanase, partial [Phytophthora megakarya]
MEVVANRIPTRVLNDSTDGGSGGSIGRIFIGLGGAVVLVGIVYAVGLFYRRRGYANIDGDNGDMRAVYCGALMVGLIAFFIFLIVTS